MDLSRCVCACVHVRVCVRLGGGDSHRKGLISIWLMAGVTVARSINSVKSYTGHGQSMARDPGGQWHADSGMGRAAWATRHGARVRSEMR